MSIKRVPPSDLSGLQSSILNTLKYSDHFNFPLTLEEINSRLIGMSVPKKSLETNLQTLINRQLINQSDGYYFLSPHQNNVTTRLSNYKVSRALYQKARSRAHQLGSMPGVLAVYLTGSLAMLNSDSSADIDFMIITRAGRLWTTRFLLTLYTSLLGLRRTPSTIYQRDKLCLNLYLSENGYQLPKSKQNLYTAYELIQAKPLYDPGDTRSALLASNPWIKKYLPNAYSSLLPISGKVFKSDSPKAGFLEMFLFKLQYLYMKRKITREYISLDSAFFHPHDPAPKI